MSAIAETIRRLEDQRYDAMLKGDARALERLLDGEAVYTHSSGGVDSKASYIEGVARLWKYRDISRTDETIVVRGDTALVFNRLRIDIDVNGVPRKLDNCALAVWTKGADGQWRMLALHSTPAQPK